MLGPLSRKRCVGKADLNASKPRPLVTPGLPTPDPSVTSESKSFKKPIVKPIAPQVITPETTAESQTLSTSRSSSPQRDSSGYSSAKTPDSAKLSANKFFPTKETIVELDEDEKLPKDKPAIVSNFFRIHLSEQRIWEYFVTVEPNVSFSIRANELPNLFKQSKLEILLDHYVYVGKVLYTGVPLEKEFVENVSLCTLAAQDRESAGPALQFKFQETNKFKLSASDEGWLHTAGVLNNGIRQAERLAGLTKIGRNAFIIDKNQMDIGKKICGMQDIRLWPGFVSSVVRGSDVAHLVVDVQYRVIPDAKANLLNKFEKQFRSNKRELDRYISNNGKPLTILAWHNMRTYKVTRVDWFATPASKVLVKGRETTFAQYYLEHYGIEVSESEPFMVVSDERTKKVIRNGEPVEIVLQNELVFPPSVCVVTGITADMARHRFSIIRESKMAPVLREKQLELYFEKIITHLKVWKNLGISFESSMRRKEEARSLGAVQLQFNRKVLTLGANAAGAGSNLMDFSRDVGQKAGCFYTHSPGYILVITISGREQETDPFFHQLREQLRSLCPELAILQRQQFHQLFHQLTYDAKNLSSLRESLEQLANRPELRRANCLVMVLPERMESKVYEFLKAFGTNFRGVPSQALRMSTIKDQRKIMGVAVKVALQLMAKSGCILWYPKPRHLEQRYAQVDLTNGVMVMGLDTAHAVNFQGNSYGAAVVSVNKEISQFYSKVEVKDSKTEVMDKCIGEALSGGLQKYKANTGTNPSAVVVFRDGGTAETRGFWSEDEATQVLKLLPKDVKCYFVLVMKRTSARFFLSQPAKTEQGIRTLNNTPAGTVVAGKITPMAADFYMVPMNVREGTARPIHYIVAHPENVSDGEIEMLERLAYEQCFNYMNWSGPVRVPAQVMYAHKLAALAMDGLCGKEVNDELSDKLHFL